MTDRTFLPLLLTELSNEEREVTEALAKRVQQAAKYLELSEQGHPWLNLTSHYPLKDVLSGHSEDIAFLAFSETPHIFDKNTDAEALRL